MGDSYTEYLLIFIEKRQGIWNEDEDTFMQILDIHLSLDFQWDLGIRPRPSVLYLPESERGKNECELNSDRERETETESLALGFALKLTDHFNSSPEL